MDKIQEYNEWLNYADDDLLSAEILQTYRKIESSFSEIVQQCMQLNPYSVLTRYPSELELTKSDTIAAINAAKKISLFIKHKINNTNH